MSNYFILGTPKNMGLPEFVSAFVEDLEPVVWKSISPEEVIPPYVELLMKYKILNFEYLIIYKIFTNFFLPEFGFPMAILISIILLLMGIAMGNL